MTIATPTTLSIPFRKDEHGPIRVSETRVTLDTLMARYLQGETPETIHVGFPTVALADIYAVIAYYLAHQAEVEAYLAERRVQAAHWRELLESTLTPEQRARKAELAQIAEQLRHEQDAQ